MSNEIKLAVLNNELDSLNELLINSKWHLDYHVKYVEEYELAIKSYQCRINEIIKQKEEIANG